MTYRLVREGKEHSRATPTELRHHTSLSWTTPVFYPQNAKARVGASDKQPDLATCRVTGFFTPRNRFRQHGDSGIARVDGNFQWSDRGCLERRCLKRRS